MSHGHGKMERYVLAVLAKHYWLGAHDLAMKYSGEFSLALRSSLGRALRKLEKENMITRPPKTRFWLERLARTWAHCFPSY